MGRGGTGSHPCESMSNDYRASSDRPDPMKIQTSAFIKNVSVPWIFTGLKIDENAYSSVFYNNISMRIRVSWNNLQNAIRFGSISSRNYEMLQGECTVLFRTVTTLTNLHWIQIEQSINYNWIISEYVFTIDIEYSVCFVKHTSKALSNFFWYFRIDHALKYKCFIVDIVLKKFPFKKKLMSR